MNTTETNIDPSLCAATSQELTDNYIEDLFDDEGAFGEADCAGL